MKNLRVELQERLKFESGKSQYFEHNARYYKVHIWSGGDSFVITDLTDAGKRGVKCPGLSVSNRPNRNECPCWDKLLSKHLHKLFELTTSKESAAEYFQLDEFEFYQRETESKRLLPLDLSIIKPLETEPKKWTIPHAIRAIVNGQYEGLRCKYRHLDDTCQDFGKGEISDAINFAKGIVEDPSGWWISKNNDGVVTICCHSFDSNEFTPKIEPSNKTEVKAEATKELEPEEAKKILEAKGIKVEETMTNPRRAGKRPRPVWQVSGNTKGLDRTFFKLGCSPKKWQGKFSFWEGDPTLEIAKAIAELKENGPQKQEPREDLTATYSPDDNKLRLYSVSRLDSETYGLLSSAGFKNARLQDLFVAPMWTPAREELLIELCGEIGEEETSLQERAEMRAERFGGYQSKRKADAESAYKQVQEISSYIPMGQPILVGHHSERKARRDAKKIENGMQRAVKMWETSEYWEYRAKAVIGHANYKDNQDVRARRVKKLEAEKRSFQRTIDKSSQSLSFWLDQDKELTLDRALFITNYHDHTSAKFTLEKYPRSKDKSQYEGSQSLWSALSDEIIKPEQAKELAIKHHEAVIKHYNKWLKHTIFRINYEKTILEAQGYKEPEKKKRATLPTLVNYPGEGFKHITKEEWKKINKDYKGTRTQPTNEDFEAYRYRTAMFWDKGCYSSSVFITDQKIVEPSKKECVAC